MSYKGYLLGILGTALLSVPATAQAERAYGAHAPEIYSTYGASVSVGGGVVGFIDNAMRDFATVGGAWDARLVFGTREDIAVEAAYMGAATPVDALGLDNNAVLLSNGIEALARVNLLKEEWQPYVMAGVGWRHYSIVNSNRNTSSVAKNDDVTEIPVGAGVAYRYEGLVIDGRGIFRAAFNDDLIARSATSEKADLHTWQAQLTAGYEF